MTGRTDTFRLSLYSPVPPEDVFRIHATPELKSGWLFGFDGMALREFRSDFRTGGSEYACFHFDPDRKIELRTDFTEIVPHSIIRSTRLMTVNGDRHAWSDRCLTLVPEDGGSRVRFDETVTMHQPDDTACQHRDQVRFFLQKLAEFTARPGWDEPRRIAS